MKYSRMRADAFAFMRGTCHRFHVRTHACRPMPCRSRLPAAWACGDLRLGNFGSCKRDNRQVYFDIDDFDEAGLAPASWDAVRWLAGLRVGRDLMGVDAAAASALGGTFVDSCAGGLAQGSARRVEREVAPPVSDLLAGLRDRKRRDFLDGRTKVGKDGSRRLRIDGRKALVATSGQQARVAAVVGDSPRRSPRRAASACSTSPGASPAPEPAAWASIAMRCWSRARARPTATTCST